ncbi:MAG: DUF4435 domain-containing protein [Prevotella sp.]|nr:DUF4435 domain-containing protein [Prevotella sp.]
MPNRLKDNLSSDYINAANRLNSKSSRRKIVAYVESYDDVYFWRTVLSQFENDTRYFEVMLPSKKNLSKGKKSVLMNLISKKVGKNMIACVDADYDYLLQGGTTLSQEVVGNPYVFHTYAYAIENLQCYAQSLHNICVGVTLNDHAIFDFVDYLKQYSEAIFPLFVWNIWHYRRNIYGEFTITDFNRVVETGNFNFENPYQGIQNVRRKVDNRVRQFQREHPDAKESYLQLKAELKALGVTPQSTYLYIQGHHLFDNLIVPMLKKVCDRLMREREREIYRNAVHNTQRRNELSGYGHCVGDIVPMLRRNNAFFSAEPYKRLQRDLDAFLNGSNRMPADAQKEGEKAEI